MLDVKGLWKQVDCICLDFDSTITTTESIDDLAEFLGKGEEITAITNKGMEGNMKFEDSLTERLKILALDLNIYENFLKNNTIQLTENVDKFVSFFRLQNIPIFIVSGGFDDLIALVVKSLNFSSNHIFANHLLFNNKGEYETFDKTKFTSHSGGKAEIINYLKNLYGYKTIFIIGDGATDMEACPPADGFIAFTGNVTRKIIMEKAKWHVANFLELIECFSKNYSVT